MGHTYSAGKNISISYGSWSEYSESAVGENDNRQVKTSRRTRKINTNNPSLSGWTLIGKSKNGFSEWESGYRFTHELPEDDGLGTEWSFEGMEYKIFHYHNLYQMPDIKANWGVDSVSNGVRSHYDEKTVSTLPPSNHYIEDKGKNYTQYKFDEKQYCDSGSRGWNIWWLKEVNYIYKKRTYEYIYSYRKIPMLSIVRQALADEYRNKLKSNYSIDGYSDFIFFNREGHLYKPMDLNRAIMRIINRYNRDNQNKIRRFSVHNLRHTFCTRLCENENNIKVIQEVMGHSNISTTMNVYAEVTDSKMQETISKIDDKIIRLKITDIENEK